MKGPALFGVLAAVGLLGGGGSAVRAGHGILFLRAKPRLGSAQVYVWRPGAAAAPIGPSTKTIDSVQWSPDGRLIAFTAQPAGGMPDANPEDIYLMRADGTKVRQLTHDSRRVVSPSWSPDGSRIVSFRLIYNSPYNVLGVVSARTGAERSLPVAGRYPAWGKPGIAYWSDGGTIMLLNPATGRSNVFVASSDNLYPFAWSNRGDLAVMQGSFGHIVIATYSARGRALTRFQLRLPYSDVCSVVSWSPGGTRLLLTVKGLLTVRNRLFHGHRPPLDKYAGLWTTTRAGKDRQRLLRLQPNGSCQTSWR